MAADPLPWTGFVDWHGEDNRTFFVRFPHEHSPDEVAEVDVSNPNVEFDAVPEQGEYVQLTEDGKLKPYDAGHWTEADLAAAKTRAEEWLALFEEAV